MMANKSRDAKIRNIIKIGAHEGAHITIDPQKFNLNSEQQSALQKLISSGSLQSLNEKQRNDLANSKASISGTAAEGGPFIRFDLKVVRIDREDLSILGEVEEVG